MPRNDGEDEEGASVQELAHAAELAVTTDHAPRPSSPRPTSRPTSTLEADDEALLVSPRLSEAAEQADLGASARRRRRGSSFLSSDGLRTIRQRISSASSPMSPLSSTISASSSRRTPAAVSSATTTPATDSKRASMMKAISAMKPKTGSSSSDSSKPKRKPRPVAQRKSAPTPPAMLGSTQSSPGMLGTPSPALSRSNSFESSSTGSGSSPPSRVVDLFPGPTRAEEIELARAQDVGRLWRTIVVEENDLAAAPSVSKGRSTSTPHSVLITPN